MLLAHALLAAIAFLCSNNTCVSEAAAALDVGRVAHEFSAAASAASRFHEQASLDRYLLGYQDWDCFASGSDVTDTTGFPPRCKIPCVQYAVYDEPYHIGNATGAGTAARELCPCGSRLATPHSIARDYTSARASELPGRM